MRKKNDREKTYLPRKYWPTVFAIWLSLHAWGQKQWTPEECIAYALENNITVKRQEVVLQQQQQALNASRMSFLPSLGANVSQSFNFGRSPSPQNNVYTDLNTRYSDFGVGMSVPLTANLENALTLSMNKLNLKAALADFEQAQQDVSLNVLSTALQVLYQREVYAVAQGQAKLSKELYERALSYMEYGKNTSTQLLEAKAQMAQDKATQTQAMNSYNQSLLELTQLLNLPSPEGFILRPATTKADESILLLTPEEIYSRALETNRGVRAETNRLLSSRKNESIMKSALYPQVSLNLGVNTGYYNIAGADPESFARQWKNNMNKSIVFTLSLPLFDRLDAVRRVRGAKLQTADRELVVKERRQRLYKDIQQAYYNAIDSGEKHLSSQTAEQATRELLEELRQRYELGGVSAYELNEVRTKWVKADIERIQALYQYEFNLSILQRYLE